MQIMMAVTVSRELFSKRDYAINTLSILCLKKKYDIGIWLLDKYLLLGSFKNFKYNTRNYYFNIQIIIFFKTKKKIMLRLKNQKECE